ncbi:C4-dicarboxylate ABC transporter substrate-binding protein [Sinomonas cyclohexanicum]|uniref:C4-dicarboxylate ABC transporter substrate-binding protein n=1 Tax=Sinomonas cyclohexanicum TaxID=322009 RepID=A0ABN6FDA7_SINCY|nr:TAXI family TRAP transporter solute-binding subunit [Corynebacterium cyclohexanicum]BCT74766.1 C4-dicarboxylate ABC transporter substrate-binding protein [Corynebacterium cyclohexanicum]
MAEQVGLTRRGLLRAGLAAGVSSLVLTAAACAPAPAIDSLTVAGGEPGGFYLEFATLLAQSFERHGVARHASAIETGGSMDNLDRIAARAATVGISLADAAADRSAGPAPSSAAGSRLVALGRVYENYVHCLVRKDSGLAGVADLAGRAVGVGAAGAGTSLTAHRLLEAAGVTVREESLGLNQGLAALRGHSIDALFWSGGVPTAAVAATAKDVGLSLIDLSPLIGPTRARFGEYYERVLVPAGAYEGIPSTWTVGAANLLLCREDLPDAAARATVELLLMRASELVPSTSLGVQFLSPETLINTAGVPLHPAAEAAYRAFHG